MRNYSSIASRIFIPHYERERPIDWDKEFDDCRDLWVEIGFGQGEFLLRNVLDLPHKYYIGIELDWGRIRKCFKKVSHLSQAEQELVFKQLRIFHINAWDAFERIFPSKRISGVECLFPCPWPKEKHERHRIFSAEFLRLLNSRLADDGSIHLVTDYWPYAQWVIEQCPETGFKLEQQTVPAKFGTKFERKWSAGGQENFCEIFFKKTRHIDIPLKEDVALKAYYHDNFVPEKFSLEEEIHENMAIVPKEWFYDKEQQKGMARVVVSEEHLTQHMWVVIIKTQKGWGVLRSEGQQLLPTSGTARAIEMVSEAVQRTNLNS